MKIILLKDVAKVGRKYDIKEVAEGYALNLLIPRGVAQVATPQAIRNVESLKAQDAMEKKVQGELLVKSLDTIKTLVLNIKEKVNEKGHLFAGITKERLIEEVMRKARINLNSESIKLDKPIKEVGEHKVTVEAMGKKAEFSVVVEGK
ncbi:MAG TPA: 50S ribosomal protein L9 [Candidatus Paceibacterota bacterium]